MPFRIPPVNSAEAIITPVDFNTPDKPISLKRTAKVAMQGKNIARTTVPITGWIHGVGPGHIDHLRLPIGEHHESFGVAYGRPRVVGRYDIDSRKAGKNDAFAYIRIANKEYFY